MPYSNLPKAQWRKMDRCVRRVQATGKEKNAAIAICYTSIVKTKAPNYGARAGETIQGDLTRGEGGRFSSGGGGDTARFSKTAIRERRREAKKNKPKKGKVVKPEVDAQTVARHGGDKADADAINRFGQQGVLSPADQTKLIAKGYAEMVGERLVITSEARRFAKAVRRGDAEGVQEALDAMARKAERTRERESKKAEREAAKAVREQERAARRAAIEQRRQEREAARAARGKTVGMLVYKTKRGLRWVAVSSNAFQDRDKEWVSQKALEAAERRADDSDYHGVLRIWHEGGFALKSPHDWTSVVAADDGWDVGDADLTMKVSRSLVHSGTFRSPEMAEVIQKNADKFRISIGFTHPPDEPKQGVYSDIKVFEVSLVPRDMASNPWTGFAVME